MGRPEEAEAWWRRVKRTIRPEAEPVAALAVYHVRGRVELARGRDTDALAAFRAAERPRSSSAPVLWACSHRPRTFELAGKSSGSWEAASSGRV
jgi:hypothetical protein